MVSQLTELLPSQTPNPKLPSPENNQALGATPLSLIHIPPGDRAPMAATLLCMHRRASNVPVDRQPVGCHRRLLHEKHNRHIASARLCLANGTNRAVFRDTCITLHELSSQTMCID